MTIKQIWFPVQKFGMNMILKVSYGHKHSIYKKKVILLIINKQYCLLIIYFNTVKNCF